MKRSCLGLTAVLLLVAVGGARAQPAPSTAACTPPAPPPPQSLRPTDPGPKPLLPPCISAQGRTSTCHRGEVDHYNVEIQAYNSRVETSNLAARHYVDALNRWTEMVGHYTHCEIEVVNGQAPQGL